MEFANLKIKDSCLGNINGLNTTASAQLGLCLEGFFRLCRVMFSMCGRRKIGKETVKSLLSNHTHDAPSHTHNSLLTSVLVMRILAFCQTLMRTDEIGIRGTNPKEFILQNPKRTGFAQSPHRSFSKTARIRKKDSILHFSFPTLQTCEDLLDFGQQGH